MPGSMASQVMGWQRRMGAIASPFAATGESGNSNPVQVELYVNGLWVDITPYVMVRDNNGEIAITRGRRDEGSTTEQSSCQMSLNNRDGRWSPRYPSGIYYGLIGRNQPVRISVPDGLGGKSYRFQGEISSWPQSWDPTGTDVWTEVEGSGILRRLAQGPPSAHSVIYDSIIYSDPPPTSLQAYWPLEDPADSATFSSPLKSGSAMRFTGTPTLAGYEEFPASDPVPALAATVLNGSVAKYDDPTATQVRFLCFIPADGLNDGTNVCVVEQYDYSPGSANFWEMYYNATTKSFTIRQCDGDGNVLGVVLDHSYDVRGRKLYVSIEFQESGTAITRAIRLYDLVTQTTYSATDTANVTQTSRVTDVYFGAASRAAVGPFGSTGLSGCAIGHVTVENAITPMTALGIRLNPIGETVGRRIQRLCAEDGIAFDYLGDLDDTVQLGNQGKANPLDLMQESELADGGMLYESMSTLGLGYRTRASLCNQDAQLTLDYAGFNLSEIPTPIEDDRYIQNQVTVTVNGVSKTYSDKESTLSTALPPAGVGVYGTDITLNLMNDSQALSQAAWRVRLGTVDEPRYPQISVNLSHPTFTTNPALKRAVLGLKQGDRVVVQNLPFWLPPGDISQIILGFQESITHFEHKITFICAPASPYQVGVLDLDAARVDTDGSVLLTDETSGATSITVVPASGKTTMWTTDSADFPFLVRAGGEVMRVTSIGSWLTDTFTRSVSGDWGTADSGQVWGSVGGTVSTDFSVNGSAGVHVLTSVDVSRRGFTDLTYTDLDYYGSITTSATATGGSIYGGLLGRYVNSDNLYHARVQFTTANAVILDIHRRYLSSATTLASYTSTITHVPGTYVRVRLKIVGSSIKAKVWLASSTEPPEWHIELTDTAITNALFVGVRSISDPANTNVNPQVRYDDLAVVNPQEFTVTRSVNGVTKAQTAGTDIRLATPTIISL